MEFDIALTKFGVHSMGFLMWRKNFERLRVTCSHLVAQLAKDFNFRDPPTSCHIRDMVDGFASQFFLVKGKYVAKQISLKRRRSIFVQFSSLCLIQKIHYFWKSLSSKHQKVSQCVKNPSSPECRLAEEFVEGIRT